MKAHSLTIFFGRPFPKLSILLAVLAMLALACALGGQTPTPMATPSLEPLKPTITPTPMLGVNVPLEDDGRPLPPQIIASKPGRGQEIAVRGSIEITFDQPMDSEVTAAAWQVLDEMGNVVTGAVNWPDARTLQFTPDQPLASGMVYQARLGSAAKSAAGVELPDAVNFTFRAVGELQVSQVFPADGSTEIASNATITVIFNRPVIPLVIAEERGSLPEPLSFDPPISGKGEWINTSVYAFHPDGLVGSTTYNVTVNAGLADATNETQLAEAFRWSFTTQAPGISAFSLGKSGYYNPSYGMMDVSPEEFFIIYFQQPMERGSVEANLSLMASNGESVPLIYDWQSNDTTLVFTPTVRLALGENYHLAVDPAAQAASGGGLREGLDWSFTTIPYPSILWTQPYNGAVGWSDTSFSIKFSAPIRLDSVKDKVVFSPAPEATPQWYYNEWDWSVYFYGVLQPSTSYEVRILPGIEDLYGNRIANEMVVRFTTGSIPPNANLVMPYTPAMYRVGGPQKFYVGYQNITSLDLRLYRLPPKYINNTYEYNPPATDLVWSSKRSIEAVTDKRYFDDYSLTRGDGSPLDPGIYFLTLDAEPVRKYSTFLDSRVIIVANANLTFKSTPTEALMWLTDLTSGEPLAGVSLSVYDESFQRIAQGTTGADGQLYLTDLPRPQYTYSTRYAMTDSGQVFAFAHTDMGSGANPWDFGIWGDYYSEPMPAKAYLYTDRPIYRPGQPVYFKGIARMDDDLHYTLPPNNLVHVTVTTYDGTTIYDQELPLTSYGTFSDQFTLDSEAPLGYYSIQAEFRGQVYGLGGVAFTVAEYRKPEFLVTVSSEQAAVLGGEMATFTAQADYYSGGGLVGAEVYWTLTAETYDFFPSSDKYSRFNFTDYDMDYGYYWGGAYTYSEIIASGQGSTDENGKFTISMPADLSDTKKSRRLTFEATVTDLSGNAVSGRTALIAHQSQVYAGIRATKYVGMAGEEQTFEVVALDWDSNPLPGQVVDVAIVEREWFSVQEQQPDGSVSWTSSVKETPVITITGITLDGEGLGKASFTPEKGGVYKARVFARDAQGNLSVASAYLWVASKDYVMWRQGNDRGLQLVTDKAAYAPGETAEILIASPFQGQPYALVTVERGHIRYHEVIRLESNSQVYRLPITADMAPNVYISVVIIKGVDETNTRPDFRYGLAQIKVDTRQQTLRVALTPDKAQAGPGDTVTYQVRTTDLDGNPVSAEVSLSLSDLATLSLADPNSPPMVDFFYNTRALSVRTSIPIVFSIEDYNADIEDYIRTAEGLAMGSGGGKGEGDFGVIQVRQNFPDTPYWEAHLITDANGQATVSVTLPDNLTTWRMDARAVTDDTRVGQTTLDIVSTKPLLVRPQTPRFFVAGDEATLGAAIHNNTDQTLTIEATLQAEGVLLAGDASQTVEIPARRQAYVTWNITVPLDASRVDLIFIADGGGYSDATRPAVGTLDNLGIPVYRYEAPETVGTAGLISQEGTFIEAISLPQDFPVSEGDLTIRVSPSLAAGMTESLTYLEHYPYDCVEQTISKFLPNVLTTQALLSAGLSDPDLEANLAEQVNTALQRLYRWQNPDGGWGWWGNQESNLTTTAYAVLGLVEAREAGYTVDAEVLDRALNYLTGKLESLRSLSGAEPYKLNRQAFVLYVLSRAGRDIGLSWAVQLFDLRDNLALYAKAYLAQVFYLADSGDPRLQTVLSDFNTQAIVSATGTHWEEAYHDYWNWNTDTRTTAIVLAALSQIDPQNPINANAVRWLMSNRTAGHWHGTQETAWTIMALTHWMVASGELNASYEYAIGLNGERIGGGVANAETLRDTYELRLSVAELLKDQANRLAIAHGEGPGNLYYTAHLTVNLPVEQIQALDQGIIVSRTYYQVDDRNTPVTEAQVGDILLVKLTIVAPHSLHYVVVDDPLPAGLEALDQSLKTSQQAVQPDPMKYGWEDMAYYGWGWWYFSHMELRDEKVVLSTDYLPAGTYTYSYLVRASSPGVFRVIPSTAQEFYFPEVYGRGDGMLFTVRP